MMRESHIIFEEIRNRDRFIISIYRIFKNKIYYLGVNKSCVNRAWFKKYVQKNAVRKIEIKLDGLFSGFYADLAYKNIDLIYESIFKDCRSMARLVSLYQNTHIKLAYKKQLLHILSRFYYINYILSMISARFDSTRVSFVPSNGIEAYRTDGCEIYDYIWLQKAIKKTGADLFAAGNVKFPVLSVFGAYLKSIKRKLTVIRKILFFLPGIYLYKFNNLFKIRYWSKFKKYYKYAIMVVSPRRQFGNNTQKISFLVDEKLIQKKEAIFFSYYRLKQEYRDRLDAGGFAYMDELRFFLSNKDILKVMPLCSLFILLFYKKSFILETSMKLLYYYLVWGSLAKNIKIDNLISYCDFSIQSIARNIICRRHNIKTYYYMDTSNFGCFYIKGASGGKYLHENFGFLYYDYLISCNSRAIEYFKDCKSEFGNYLDLGCFWSQHLKELILNVSKPDLMLQLYECRCICNDYKEGMKLVAVFDSTFHDDSITTYQGGINFLSNILKLLDDMPDIFVVLKEKKIRAYHRTMTSESDKILELYNKLDAHPRYVSLKGGEEAWRNSSEIIALCDLTIAFPFVSAVFEAISARKKAIWHDASGKFLNTFYDSMPGLVTHNYSELLARTKTLLYDLSEDKYGEYLDTYIKGKMESYLDGMAITRFRKLLAENTK